MTILRENPIAEELIQMGVMEGRQEGRREGRREAIIDALAFRFETVPDEIHRSVTAVEDPEELQRLLRKAIAASTLTEFQAGSGA